MLPMNKFVRLLGFLTLVAMPAIARADTWDICAGDDFQAAIKACTQIINAGKEPPVNMAMAFSNRARAHYNLGDNDKAIDDATKAIGKNARNTNAWLNRGNAWFAKEDFEKAAADYQKAIGTDAKSAAAHFNFGLAHHRMSNYDKAIASITTALKYDSNNADYYKTRGNAKYESSQYADSVADYDRAIRIKPNFGYAHYDRGLSHEQLGDFAKAKADFDKAAQLIPSDDSWHQEANKRSGLMEEKLASNNSGGSAKKQDQGGGFGGKATAGGWDVCAGEDHAAAIEACTEIIDEGKEPAKNMAMAWSNRARAHYNRNEFDDAISDASEAISLNSNFTNAYINRGNAWFGKEDFQKAADDYAEAVRTNPKNPDAHFNFGLAHHRMQNYDKAIASIDKAISFDAKNADYYKTRGNAKYNLDRYEESIADYDKALQLNSKYGYAYYDRGLSYEQLLNFSKALENFKKAAQLIPSSDTWREEAEKRVALMQDKLSGSQTAQNETKEEEKVETGEGASAQTLLSSANSSRRIALVIGNGAYRNAGELANPRNDADAMARMLAGIGFDVVSGMDLDKRQMDQKVREFIDKVDSYDIALVFYAGHGISVGGKSYLLPVDAMLDKASALEFEAVEADKLYAYMSADNRTSVVLLDACRNNPFARSFSRSLGATRAALVGQGLAAPNVEGGGILIGFATAPGDVAADGEGKNSPFTEALLKHMPQPGIEIEQVMKKVKAEVFQKTNGKQRPWHNSDLIQSVFLR